MSYPLYHASHLYLWTYPCCPSRFYNPLRQLWFVFHSSYFGRVFSAHFYSREALWPLLHFSFPVNKQDILKEEINAGAKAQSIAEKMMELRKQRRNIDKTLRKYEKELADIFDDSQTDSMEIKMGLLVRRKNGEKTEWVIELWFILRMIGFWRASMKFCMKKVDKEECDESFYNREGDWKIENHRKEYGIFVQLSIIIVILYTLGYLGYIM